MARFLCVLLPALLPLATAGSATAADATVDRWAVFELALEGPRTGNPFADVPLAAELRNGDDVVRVSGFYDGDGVFRVRFMPGRLGEWTYVTRSSVPALDGKTGRFVCVPPGEGNHGPVRVRNTFHFAYADGTPYRQIGTTSYAWIHQPEALQQQTLRTLAVSPFNKMRMCIFPKHYVYNANEPALHPFPREAGRNDTTRFDPGFWRHLEARILDLQRLGIEADIILFHPYDRWGYAEMDQDTDDRYLRYAIARLASFRNVWWSLANEFDFMGGRSMARWDHVFETIATEDPYGHLRGIHNGARWYDHARPWVTHASIQSSEFDKLREWREKYRKPIVVDECRYEGDIPEEWGNLAPQEMVDRFWRGLVAGVYVGHGETYRRPDDVLWWSKGGVLHGESPARIAFLKRFLEEAPEEGIEPLGEGVGGREGEQYIHYFPGEAPPVVDLSLPPGATYQAEVIDSWSMSVTALPRPCIETCRLELPRKAALAVRVRRTGFAFPAEPVAIGWPGALFVDRADVTLAHPTHRDIHYTLDGTPPNETSPLYERPIVVDRDLTLRVYSIGDDGRTSERLTRAFRKARLSPAVRAGQTTPGVRFSLYEGEWRRLPDFAALTPVRTGVATGFDLSPRRRDDQFGLVFEGLLDVPGDGIYYFATRSDDGSQLFVDGQLVVDNDGEHAPVATSGEIALAKGRHALRLTFFENRGGEELAVEWEGPGFGRQPIPEARLLHAVVKAGAGSGTAGESSRRAGGMRR